MLPSTKFYMIRHGETVANAKRYASGAMDTPLTDKGLQQALDTHDVFKTLTPKADLIIHSNLSRARDTAHIINSLLKLPMVEEASIAEQNFGDWQGMPWDDLRAKVDNEQTPPNGESLEIFYDRAINGLSKILNQNEDKLLLITCHGGIFAALFNHFNIKKQETHNCALYEFEIYNDGQKLSYKALN